MPFQTIFCFFLISIVGISHGALDHVKGSNLMKFYKIPATTRVSFGLYNTFDEIDYFANALKKAISLLS